MGRKTALSFHAVTPYLIYIVPLPVGNDIILSTEGFKTIS